MEDLVNLLKAMRDNSLVLSEMWERADEMDFSSSEFTRYCTLDDVISILTDDEYAETMRKIYTNNGKLKGDLA